MVPGDSVRGWQRSFLFLLHAPPGQVVGCHAAEPESLGELIRVLDTAAVQPVHHDTSLILALYGIPSIRPCSCIDVTVHCLVTLPSLRYPHTRIRVYHSGRGEYNSFHLHTIEAPGGCARHNMP